MDYSIETSALDKLESDCIIVGIYPNQQLTATAKWVDDNYQGLVLSSIKQAAIDEEKPDTLLITLPPEQAIKRILLVSLGHKDQLTGKRYRKVLAAAASALKIAKIGSAHCGLTDASVIGHTVQWQTRQIIEIFNDQFYQYNQTKSIRDTPKMLSSLHILVTEGQKTAADQGRDQGLAISQGIELTKFLADLPGNYCTPSFLADQAVTLANNHDNLSVDIIDESGIEALKMGAFLSVSRGSRQPAKLIVLNYRGSTEDQQPIVLVGKGLTFDAGGISLKPGAGMDEMKYDMCGGASVLGTLQAVAQMQLPINVVGIVPSSENLPDGDANKPGDVVTSMSGLTIEILNTDAEGRLILCDALTYAKRFNPDVVIDLATLTGACLVALGRVPSGLLGNNDELCQDLINASETACDSLWRLPLWSEYQEQLESSFADMANIGGRDAGTITAACFLSRFTKDYPWAHLDIAGTAWRTGNNKGATGRPVSLLIQYLINRANA